MEKRLFILAISLIILCVSAACGKETPEQTETLEPEEISAPEPCAHTHFSVIEAVGPTCTESGRTEGKKCDDCGQVLIAEEEIPALGHEIEIIPAVEATYDTEGSTEGQVCTRCGEILVPVETVPCKDIPYLDLVRVMIRRADGDMYYDDFSFISQNYYAESVFTAMPYWGYDREQYRTEDENGDTVYIIPEDVFRSAGRDVFGFEWWCRGSDYYQTDTSTMRFTIEDHEEEYAAMKISVLHENENNIFYRVDVYSGSGDSAGFEYSRIINFLLMYGGPRPYMLRENTDDLPE